AHSVCSRQQLSCTPDPRRGEPPLQGETVVRIFGPAFGVEGRFWPGWWACRRGCHRDTGSAGSRCLSLVGCIPRCTTRGPRPEGWCIEDAPYACSRVCPGHPPEKP